MKKVSVFMLAILLFCLFSPICLAQNNQDDYSELNTPNVVSGSEMDNFISYISLFFESKQTFSAIDFDGNDISDEFFNSYYSLYTSKEFASLKVIADCQIAHLLEKGNEPDTNRLSRDVRSVRTTYNVSNYRLFITQPPAPFSSQGYSTILTSSFVAAPFADIIFSATNPALTVYGDGGGVYPYELSNVIIYTPTIASGRVTFSAQFSLYKVVGTSRHYSGTFIHTDTYNSAGNLK